MTYEIKNSEKPTYFVAYSANVSHVGVAMPMAAKFNHITPCHF